MLATILQVKNIKRQCTLTLQETIFGDRPDECSDPYEIEEHTITNTIIATTSTTTNNEPNMIIITSTDQQTMIQSISCSELLNTIGIT